MHFHFCNENRGVPSRSLRRLWRAGRCWWHLGDRRGRIIAAEWHLRLKPRGPFLTFRVDHDEPDITLGLGLLGTSLYVSFERFHRPPAGLAWGNTEREISLRTHDGAIWWTLWRDTTIGRPGDWRDSNFQWLDFLLGKMRRESLRIDHFKTSLVMPEGAYPCTVTIDEDRWWRPRWPWRQIVRMVGKVDFGDRGVPIPGKGENGWDCGDDAVFSMSCSAATADEVLARVRADVLGTRERRAGADWVPADGWGFDDGAAA